MENGLNSPAGFFDADCVPELEPGRLNPEVLACLSESSASAAAAAFAASRTELLLLASDIFDLVALICNRGGILGLGIVAICL